MITRPLEAWPTIHRDAYPAYITWDAFMANQAQLTDNANRFDHRTRGAVRQGDAVLVGLVVCGRCGRQMRVGYKPHIRYFCSALSQAYGESQCLNLDGPSIEQAVVQAFFEAIQPAELDLLDAVLSERRADREHVARQHADRVARAAYEVAVARRQYDAVDPDNRLVAAELERRWELALRAAVETQEAAARFEGELPEPDLAPTVRAQLHDVGRQLPALWASGRLTPAHKKTLLRTLIRRVILARPQPDRIEIKVVWVSGAFSVLVAHPPIHRTVDLSDYERLTARVLALAADGYPDPEIARRLTAEGFRSARDPTGVPARFVAKVRWAHGQTSLSEQFRQQEQIDGQWTIWGLARAIGVDRTWIYRRIGRGTLQTERHPTTGHHLIPDDPDLVASLRAEAAAGRRRQGTPEATR
jgi:hypothetical protein